MHMANRLFWARCATRYPRHFTSPARVVECGSYDVNGSIRDYFTATNYVGVDWRPGPGVDLISLTHELTFPPASFDAVVSASMLEHDPYWEQSLAKMVELMKPDGILIITWGSALNGVHELGTAPDGQFHALPAGRAIRALRNLGIHVREFQYERTILREAGIEDGTGRGEVALVGFKVPVEPVQIDDLLPEDCD